jgi:4-aminobutyrate aminotransferase-like enzyme
VDGKSFTDQPQAAPNNQGDPMRAIQAKKMLEIIRKHDLVNHTAKIGTSLYASLEKLAASDVAQGKVSGLRGKDNGTLIAWDFADPAMRDGFVMKMRAKGVQIGACGERSVSGVCRIELLLTLIGPPASNAHLQ